MILAIDIGGTFIKFGLVDDDFKISNQSKVSTPTTLDGFWLTLEHSILSRLTRISFLGLPLRALAKSIVNVASFSRAVLSLI